MDVEGKAHEILAAHRVNSSREFFMVSVEKAIETIRIAAVEEGGIDRWKSATPHYLRTGDRLALSLEAGQTFCHLYYKDEMALLAGKIGLFDAYQAHSNGDLLEIMVTDSPEGISSYAEGHYWGTTDPVPFLDREGKAANGTINGLEILGPGERLVWLPAPDRAKEQSAVVFEALDYCQLVSRTWSPQFLDGVFPLLFNHVTHEEAPPELTRAMHAAIDLPVPRNWSPHFDPDREWVERGRVRRPPDYWLPQLKLRKKGKESRT
jgi:hypothetical protein